MAIKVFLSSRFLEVLKGAALIQSIKVPCIAIYSMYKIFRSSGNDFVAVT